MIKQLGVIPDLCVEDYILCFFKDLNIQAKSVSALDPTLAKFQNLKVLNLSFNCISKIEFIPPNLEELYLNGNQINEVSLNFNKPINSLIHIGLSMNQIRQTALSCIVKAFPNLFCLDISFNELTDMESALTWCK